MTDEVVASEVDVDAPPRRLREVKVPAQRAMVFICQRCERRVHADGQPARRIARRLRKLSRDLYGKRGIRSVMTSCMSLCPRDAITVAVVPAKSQKPHMYIADAGKPKAAARELLTLLGKL